METLDKTEQAGERRVAVNNNRINNKCAEKFSVSPPDEFVLQRAGRHRNLHAAFHGHLQRGAVLLKQEVPPLRRPGTDHKHGHGDVDREAANRWLSV